MIDNCCPVVNPLRRAFHTEGMCSEEQLAGFLPCAVITAACSRTHCFWMEGKMLVAILRAAWHQG